MACVLYSHELRIAFVRLLFRVFARDLVQFFDDALAEQFLHDLMVGSFGYVLGQLPLLLGFLR